ncbi:MAG: hypothetical protein QXH85_05685 [Candidatus Bathyarchaeia archaeon]
MAKADRRPIKEKTEEKQTTTLGTIFKKASEVEAEQQEKPKPIVVTDFNDLIKSREKWVIYKKRLAYKNWTLYIFKRDNRFTIRVTAYRDGKIYIKLNIMLSDIEYLSDLLDLVVDAFKRFGIPPTTL